MFRVVVGEVGGRMVYSIERRVLVVDFFGFSSFCFSCFNSLFLILSRFFWCICREDGNRRFSFFSV